MRFAGGVVGALAVVDGAACSDLGLDGAKKLLKNPVFAGLLGGAGADFVDTGAGAGVLAAL